MDGLAEPAYRTPGEKWSRADVDWWGERIEGGLGLDIPIVGTNGPYIEGSTLRLPHIHWVRWVMADEDRNPADFAHPPGYIVDMESLSGDLFGYYQFDREAVGLVWHGATPELCE